MGAQEERQIFKTDKQHGQYAICSAAASQTAYAPETVGRNAWAPQE